MEVVIMKRLVRSKDDVKLAGVCSGLATYLGIDPTVVRIVYALATIFTGVGLGIILYIACIFIMPVDDDIID